ncbi:unnamed protein product [marine sediment metagenome]|uniref:Ribbon-helix-helix protein CopG domain-containing protein n=1 Tax=marine sediment metagenome TaxID=412755 RepID=X1GEM0_9ZZZZ
MAKKYRTVSIPIGIADDIKEIIEKLGYWPSVGAFVREATVKMVTEWQDRLKETENPDMSVPIPIVLDEEGREIDRLKETEPKEKKS